MEDVVFGIKSEKVSLLEKEKKRIDGRKFDEYREIKIQKNISQNADGSARVQIGKTIVIAGVKMVLAEPYPDTPDQGGITIGAELLPLASASFETGPPNEASIELARVVDRGIRESKFIDVKKLCITEKEKVWMSFIDIYAINDDGNMLDAAFLAAVTSLLETKLPKLENGEVVKGETDGKLKLLSKPTLCTFAKINQSLLLDPGFLEEKAMKTKFSIAITDQDQISAFQKAGVGSLLEKEVSEAIETAVKKSKELRKFY